MTHKYVRHSEAGFVVWPRIESDLYHSHVGSMLSRSLRGGCLMSAGFVRFEGGKAVCYGRSESLDMDSLPEDSELLAAQLGLTP